MYDSEGDPSRHLAPVTDMAGDDTQGGDRSSSSHCDAIRMSNSTAMKPDANGALPDFLVSVALNEAQALASSFWGLSCEYRFQGGSGSAVLLALASYMYHRTVTAHFHQVSWEPVGSSQARSPSRTLQFSRGKTKRALESVSSTWRTLHLQQQHREPTELQEESFARAPCAFKEVQQAVLQFYVSS